MVVVVVRMMLSRLEERTEVGREEGIEAAEVSLLSEGLVEEAGAGREV